MVNTNETFDGEDDNTTSLIGCYKFLQYKQFIDYSVQCL